MDTVEYQVKEEKNGFVVLDAKGKYKIDLRKRIFDFVIRVVKYLKKFHKSVINDVIVYQLMKAATSMGANYEEAQGASSRADFSNKIAISHKESKETNYWLRVLKSSEIDNSAELEYLIKESGELRNILGSIAGKVRSKK